MWKLIVFDLDGTLLNSLDDLIDSTNHALTAHQLPQLDTDFLRVSIGGGVDHLVITALAKAQNCSPEDISESLVQSCISALRTHYSTCWNSKSHVYEGISELLDLLQQRKIQTAVLSNKPHEFTLKVVEHFFPEAHFKSVQGFEKPFLPKPDPTLALRIIQEARCAPHEVAVVGDTAYDMQTAVRCQAHPIGVLWGFRQAQELLESGAQLLLQHPQDLVSHI